MTYAFQFEDEADEKPTQWYKGFDSEAAAHAAAAERGGGRRYRLMPIGPNSSGTAAISDWITPDVDEKP